MPAAIDTGGFRVLYCDFRADNCLTTPVHVSSSIGECQIDRTYTGEDCREVYTNPPVEILNWSSFARSLRNEQIYGIDKLDLEQKERESKCSWESDRKQCRNKFYDVNRLECNSVKTLPNFEWNLGTNDKHRSMQTVEETILIKNCASTLILCRRHKGGNRLESLGKTRRLSFASKCFHNNEYFPYIARNYRVEDVNVCDKQQAESRVQNDTERITIHQKDWFCCCSWTSSRPSSSESKVFNTNSDHPEITHIIKENPLLSSHHHRYRCSNEEFRKDIAKVHSSEVFPDDDTWRRYDYSERYEHSRKVPIRNNPRSITDKRRIKYVHGARMFLQLLLLFLVVAFGRNDGLIGPCAHQFSARPIARGLSVLTIGTIIVGAVNAAPIDLFGDTGFRAERSANLSHITGASRKIQMYIKHRHLQILPDGTVNGSNDDTSEYTIFQRTSVSRGQLRIQGVATCLYLCMDSCGLLYGSSDYTEDCTFNETLEQHNYNTYSSARWSTPKKTLFLGLNRHGQPRRVQVKGRNLGRLSAYARVLTQMAPIDRVEALQRRMLGAQHNIRHRHHDHHHHRHHGDIIHQTICPIIPAQEKDGRDKFRCRKRKKRKKRKRWCRSDEQPGSQCQVSGEVVMASTPETVNRLMETMTFVPESQRSCKDTTSEEEEKACKHQTLTMPAKKRMSRTDDHHPVKTTINGGNLTLNGKNKATTSNEKNPNVEGDSQSKKPNLTDGKKKKKVLLATSKVTTISPTSFRKRYVFGTAASRTSLPLAVATGKLVPIVSSCSSSSLPGASTVFSVRSVDTPRPGSRKSPPSSRNYIARPIGWQDRVGKSFSDFMDSSDRSRLMPQSMNPAHHYHSSVTKVPATIIPPYLQSSTILSSSFPQKFIEDSSKSLADSLLVDEESSSIVSNEYTTEPIVQLTTALTASVETEMTTQLVEEEGDSSVTDTIPWTTMRFPYEQLAM